MYKRTGPVTDVKFSSRDQRHTTESSIAGLDGCPHLLSQMSLLIVEWTNVIVNRRVDCQKASSHIFPQMTKQMWSHLNSNNNDKTTRILKQKLTMKPKIQAEYSFATLAVDYICTLHTIQFGVSAVD